MQNAPTLDFNIHWTVEESYTLKINSSDPVGGHLYVQRQIVRLDVHDYYPSACITGI